MKKFSKLSVIILSISLLLVSCKESAEKKQKPDTTLENKLVEKSAPMAVLNANLATESDLIALGLSSELVTKLLAARPFLTMADFNANVAEENTEELFKKLFVPFNLNTTAEKDFKVIPGVGDKMTHEFIEYRPYSNLAQFRKEIGKYVDDKELNRLERFVYLKE